MELIGEEIAAVVHGGGTEVEGVLVDRYVILLKSGRSIELTMDGVIEASGTGMLCDPVFDWMIGLKIEAVELSDFWPTPGLRLNNRRVVFMGSPAPYYWGLEDREA